MNRDFLKERIHQTEEALGRLDEALKTLDAVKNVKIEYEVHVDAVIKRYETLFEYVWKMLKAFAEYQGSEAPGPRPAIQEAIRFGWIEDPQFWVEALDARNDSVHDYFGIPVDSYLKIIVRFSSETKRLFSKLSTVAGNNK